MTRPLPQETYWSSDPATNSADHFKKQFDQSCDRIFGVIQFQSVAKQIHWPKSYGIHSWATSGIEISGNLAQCKHKNMTHITFFSSALYNPMVVWTILKTSSKAASNVQEPRHNGRPGEALVTFGKSVSWNPSWPIAIHSLWRRLSTT